jgi:hypothetical protein
MLLVYCLQTWSVLTFLASAQLGNSTESVSKVGAPVEWTVTFTDGWSLEQWSTKGTYNLKH